MRDGQAFERLSAEERPPAPGPHGGREARGGQLAQGPPSLVPRGVGAILDEGLDLLRRRSAAIVGVSVLLWLPVRALQPFVGQHVWMERLEQGESGALLGLVASWSLSTLSGGLVQMLLAAVVVQLAVAEMLGEPASAGAALARGLRRLWALILLSVLVALAAGAGLVLCLAPYFLVMWRLSLTTSVCVVEELGVAQSLSRSVELTARSFLRWLGLTVVAGILALLFSLPAALLDEPEMRLLVLETLKIDAALLDGVGVFVSALFHGLATAIVASVSAVYYVDCRVRRDGLDLERRLAAARAQAGSTP